MKTTIIQYNAGNVRSLVFALERLGIQPVVSNEADEILSADRVIFPGVGEASSAMDYLRERKLDQLIPQLKQPVLGICLGMQLMCDFSEEGDTPCLGIFETRVKKFSAEGIKVPHTGWNTVEVCPTNLFEGVNNGAYVYFVHSFYVEQGPYTIASTQYGSVYSSAIGRKNFYGVQFHPEKSGSAGKKILENFLKLN